MSCHLDLTLGEQYRFTGNTAVSEILLLYYSNFPDDFSNPSFFPLPFFLVV